MRTASLLFSIVTVAGLLALGRWLGARRLVRGADVWASVTDQPADAAARVTTRANEAGELA